MLALIAMIAFILSPFVTHLGPWPMVTVGLVLVSAHLVWYVGATFLRARPDS